MVSGQIQTTLHYPMFFAFVLTASVPPIIIAWFAPFRSGREA
jgi:hypothetical protein